MKRACIGCGRITTGSRCPACISQKNRDYGRGYRGRRALVIGGPCELRLAGCTGVANSGDHIIPRSRGGAAGPLRGACLHCNIVRGNRPDALLVAPHA